MINNEAPSGHYVYWVSYVFSHNSGHGYGAMRVWSTVPANSLNWVNRTIDYLMQENRDFTKVTPLNWIRLDADESWALECSHEYEWVGGGSTPDGPIEPNHVCKHCGAENQEDAIDKEEARWNGHEESCRHCHRIGGHLPGCPELEPTNER